MRGEFLKLIAEDLTEPPQWKPLWAVVNSAKFVERRWRLKIDPDNFVYVFRQHCDMIW